MAKKIFKAVTSPVRGLVGGLFGKARKKAAESGQPIVTPLSADQADEARAGRKRSRTAGIDARGTLLGDYRTGLGS